MDARLKPVRCENRGYRLAAEGFPWLLKRNAVQKDTSPNGCTPENRGYRLAAEGCGECCSRTNNGNRGCIAMLTVRSENVLMFA